MPAECSCLMRTSQSFQQAITLSAKWRGVRGYCLRLAFLSAVLAAPAGAAEMETILMPGPVIEGHAKVEADCKQCHIRFDKSAQVGLCNECHRDVAKDFALNRGRHGRLEEQECRVCHTDHRGRKFNITPFDEKKFDHRLTDFELKGGHARPEVVCADCHLPAIKYRDAPSACVACHKKDDAHKGKLGTQCANCHTDSDWKTARFNHSLTTFPLLGKHADVPCKDCHADPNFKGAPSACIACHKKDDKHKAQFGAKCEACHVAKDWKTLSFDHDRDTRYALRGKHAQARCVTCHKGVLYRDKTPTACVACHKRDDKHKGRFSDKCEACHVEKDWTVVIFDHNRQTKYPLLGKHAPVKCSACHKGVMYKDKTDSYCYTCHQKDDKHKGQQGKDCVQCHNERSWVSTKFDHDLTKFPLLSKHKNVKCKECHLTPMYKDAQVACVACHLKEDKHKRRLGPDCGLCHNARGWRIWDYDHDKRTRFKLDGGHKGIACLACHKRPADKDLKLPVACASCHSWDDVHNGRFGKECEHCHVTSSFKKARIGDRTFPSKK